MELDSKCITNQCFLLFFLQLRRGNRTLHTTPVWVQRGNFYSYFNIKQVNLENNTFQVVGMDDKFTRSFHCCSLRLFLLDFLWTCWPMCNAFSVLANFKLNLKSQNWLVVWIFEQLKLWLDGTETDRRIEENVKRCVSPYGTVNKYGHGKVIRTNSSWKEEKKALPRAGSSAVTKTVVIGILYLYSNVLDDNAFCGLCFLLNFSKLQTYIHILEVILDEVKLNIYHVDITSRNVTENYAGWC